jgi:hypothetical protein
VRCGWAIRPRSTPPERPASTSRRVSRHARRTFYLARPAGKPAPPIRAASNAAAHALRSWRFCGTAAAWLSGTCFLVRAVGRATATAAGFDLVFCDSHARARPGSVTLAAVNPGTFSADQARDIGERIGIDWKTARFDVVQFRMGLDVELEHGRRDPATNVSDNDEVTTGKIAWAHLNEFPDYYTRLARMESEADRYWSARDQDSAV